MTDEAVDEIRQFWEQAGELFCVLDADGRFLRVNPAWTRVLGWDADELGGMRAADLLHGGDRCATESAEETPDGQLVIRDVENRYRHRDGSIRWLRWNGYERDGRWYGTAKDITASRTMDLALRISEGRARAMLEAMDDGLVVIDGNGRVVEVNGVFSRLVGRSVREIVGLTPPYPWWPPGAETRMASILTDYLAGIGGADELEVMRRDGRHVPVLVHIARLPEQRGKDALLVVVRDISEVVALRDRLARAHQVARLAAWEWFPADDRLTVYGDGTRPDMPPVYQMTGDEGLASVAPEHREEFARLRRATALGERESFSMEVLMQGDHGYRAWVEIRGETIRTPEGVAVGAHGTAQQIAGPRVTEPRSARTADPH